MKFFDLWNRLKKMIDQEELRVFFHPRAVWMCQWGENVGYEQNGKGKEFLRPVLIIKKFNNNVFLGLPLTSQVKTGKKFYHEIPLIRGKRNWVILSQIRLLDAKRLRYKIGEIPEKEFLELKKIISEIILSDDDLHSNPLSGESRSHL